ncbi:unnamed protein product [Effrenium voratum]|nr:unnamed protein product [Effrenium voratum]
MRGCARMGPFAAGPATWRDYLRVPSGLRWQSPGALREGWALAVLRGVHGGDLPARAAGGQGQATAGEPHELETRTWQAGTSLRYQCQPPFTGTVTATCEDDGHFSLHGRCVALCAPPPHLARAVAAYSEDTAKQGFFEGLRVKYDCLPGYGGTLFATCREDGKYSDSDGIRLVNARFCGF